MFFFFFNLSGYLKQILQKQIYLSELKSQKHAHLLTMTIATQVLLNFLNQMCLNK